MNDLQDAARALCPEIDEALFPGAMVSGSGPTVFATYPTIEAAHAAAHEITGAIVARPASRGFGEVAAA